MRVSVKSFAKVNLFLQVLGKRIDGFHELRTVFCGISLHDTLYIDCIPGKGKVSVEVTGEYAGRLSTDERNLAYRAAKSFITYFGIDYDVDICIDKQIPIGAGLGGGSSNAGFVLIALSKMFGIKIGKDIFNLARGLGSDVPFFLVGGMAVGFGRGDEVVGLPDKDLNFLIFSPSVEVATFDIYQRLGVTEWKNVDSSFFEFVCNFTGVDTVLAYSVNDLEAPLFALYPGISSLFEEIRNTYGFARVSGSGSSIFTIFKKMLKCKLTLGTRVIRSSSVSKGKWIQIREN